MKLEYIKAGDVFYRPQESGARNPNILMGNYPVCKIKKLRFGMWQVDYFDIDLQFVTKGRYSFGDEDTPNQRLILYPSGIQEIRYSYE